MSHDKSKDPHLRWKGEEDKNPGAGTRKQGGYSLRGECGRASAWGGRVIHCLAPHSDYGPP